MGLDIVIPLLVLAVCLLPNLLIIWAARKLQVSRRLGNWAPVLAASSLIAVYVGYTAIRADALWVSLFAAIFGALTAITAIDYCLARQNLILSIIGVLVYFGLLVFYETMIFGIVGHM